MPFPLGIVNWGTKLTTTEYGSKSKRMERGEKEIVE